LIASGLAAARLPQCVGAIGNFFFVDELQIVSVEVLEPFIPRNGPKSVKSGKIEAYASATIVHLDSGGAGRSGFSGRWLRPTSLGPAADDIVVLSQHRARPGWRPLHAHLMRKFFVLRGGAVGVLHCSLWILIPESRSRSTVDVTSSDDGILDTIHVLEDFSRQSEDCTPSRKE
jgi:hypothetical protein